MRTPSPPRSKSTTWSSRASIPWKSPVPSTTYAKALRGFGLGCSHPPPAPRPTVKEHYLVLPRLDPVEIPCAFNDIREGVAGLRDRLLEPAARFQREVQIQDRYERLDDTLGPQGLAGDHLGGHLRLRVPHHGDARRRCVLVTWRGHFVLPRQIHPKLEAVQRTALPHQGFAWQL